MALVVAAFATSALPAAAPIWPTSTWVTATPAEMGMDPVKLAQARDYALTGGGSGYIIRGGKLVMSWGNAATLYELKSSTKSVGVTALGLALKDGLVGLPNFAQLYLSDVGLPPSSNTGTGWLDDITLRQLATHTAGFDKDGGYIPLVFQPGSTFSYSDGGANWLADVLTVVFARDLRALMFERVFTPLGIKSTDLTWRSNAYRSDTIRGFKRREFGSGISADVDAMARIGYLYLRRGLWNAQRILEESFIDAASRPVPQIVGLPVNDVTNYFNASNHYGLLWWNNGDGTLPGVPLDAYWSCGLYDSLIVVIPSLDIVAARAGSGWRGSWNADYLVVKPFIGPIAASATCVPNDPGATDADHDGFGVACDCDDSMAATYPGAPEVNDGLDNECPGDEGRGLVDELSGVTGFLTSGDRNDYSWKQQTGAASYEVERSDSASFTGSCWNYITSGLHWSDPAIPAAGGVYFYLVHPLTPRAGSWGEGAAGAERTVNGCHAF